ncbi:MULTISPECIES: SipW-dependent-type signal peptide-containing protein [Gordonia]|uniref:SipW-dependent-type signal peptide-containing protein n=1 Tax=Gordonia TaxID=2053 RepID=UPI0012BB2B06|nr:MULTISPECIES: SipW-dependent-type signal peptide-containing protein [Gordonia]MDH3007066.1 SipW-dependent-type signal peptide-containing protein [Gordonia alkanivorans]MDH3013280.1 SipW-dependent-type signal peptide-containing protein [Gordonia alkanivorans]MDH3045724.1 SipW-dependent-type signal peptide-containing protein [Gordonia alkanivorans]MDJ0027377.1 SipW-dependent-type signal peptide-containing protein [Gordonia alkanivorans]QGP86557.1 hypothetical protein GKZ92_02155 [Gordonia sp.
MTDVVRRVSTVLRSTRVRAVLACGIVFGLGTVGTMAAWSATNTTTSGTFTTGSVDLWLNNVNATTTAPLALNLGTGVLPGQSRAVMINVQNRGPSAAMYTTTIRGATEGARAMTLSVAVGGSVSGNTCTASPVLTGQAITASATPILGNRGELAATTGTDPLCMQLTLPTAAANTLQSAPVTVVVTFTGTAVAGV